MIYDYYLAGPFFNDEQVNMQEKIENLMTLHGKKCFSPRLDAGTLPKNAKKEEMLEVFHQDLDAINNCKCLFANVSFRDTGTSVEIGYALSRDIPIVLYWNDKIHDSDHVNLMIAMACGGKVLNNWTDLSEYLETGFIPERLQFKVD